MQNSGVVYWFTGLSGAGKTTLARLFHARLLSEGGTAVFLDGDILRGVFGNDLGHTREDRLNSAMRNARLCKLISDQNIDVVCATISLFHECHGWNRTHIPRYKEIYVEAPLRVLENRDPKQIYKGAKKGTVTNVAGIHFPVEIPKSPDFHILNDGIRTPEQVTQDLWQQIFLPRRAGAQ